MDEDFRLVGLSLDPAGHPWVCSTSGRGEDPRLYVCQWDGAEWRSHEISTHLPQDRRAGGGTFTVDTKGRLHLALSAVHTGAPKSDGVSVNVSNEIFHVVCSPSIEQVEVTQVSETNEAVASWSPSISKGGLFAPVSRPAILYTHGVSHDPSVSGHRHRVNNKVYCAWVEDD